MGQEPERTTHAFAGRVGVGGNGSPDDHLNVSGAGVWRTLGNGGASAGSAAGETSAAAAP